MSEPEARLKEWHIDVSRLVADGIAYPDIERAAVELPSWSEWFQFWAARGEEYARAGEQALSCNRQVLAGELLWRASMAYHYAQFMWFHEPAMREAGQHRKAQLYDRAAPLLWPAAERFHVSVDNVSIAAYLRLPLQRAPGPCACVVLLGGLESTKEESYLFENDCLRRGVATCAFDGPGQGEVFFDVKLRGDFDRYTTAVLDALLERSDIDGSRIGVLGRSLGGNYAVRSAAMDQRLVACAAWGAMVDMCYWSKLDPAIQRGFAYVAGFTSEQLHEAGMYLNAALDLRPVLDRVRCPVYIQHGELDQVIPASQVEPLRTGLVNASEVTVDVLPGANHCGHNVYQVGRPRLVDWICGQLGGRY